MSESRPTLKECTKSELLFVIERLMVHLSAHGDYVLSRALLEVGQAREEKKFTKAQQLSDYADQKRQEYINLLAPYEGKRLADVPVSVIEKANSAMKEAQQADRKWNDLMGIGGGDKS